jgi:hypothetical protein
VQRLLAFACRYWVWGGRHACVACFETRGAAEPLFDLLFCAEFGALSCQYFVLRPRPSIAGAQLLCLPIESVRTFVASVEGAGTPQPPTHSFLDYKASPLVIPYEWLSMFTAAVL